MTRRPPFDPAAFVFGALFTVLAIVGLLDAETARRIDLTLLLPATLVVVGGLLVAGSVLPRRR
jgi:hypothetical protein